MEDAGNLLNHTLAAPLKVAGKDLQMTSSRVCWRFKIVLKASIWSMGPSCHHRTPIMANEILEAGGTPKH